MRKPLILLLCLAASACMTPQPAVPSPARLAQAEMQEAESYCRSLWADPRLAPLRDRIPFSRNELMPHHLADRSKPDARQRAAVPIHSELSARCQARRRAVAEAYYPQHLPALETKAGRIAELEAALQEGEISFGDFNALMQEAQHLFLAEVAEINSHLRGAQAFRAPPASAGAPSPILSLWQPQPATSSVRTSDCLWFGSTWSCKSLY